MRMQALVFLVVLVGAGLGVAADNGKEDAVKKDLAELKGTWAIISAERDGKTVTDKTVTLTFDGAGRATVKKGDAVLFKGTSNIDPTKKPKTYDVTEDSEGVTKGKTFPGIYELNGDTLRICSVVPEMDRPTEFASKPGRGYFLRVYQRQKNASASPVDAINSDAAKALQGFWRGESVTRNGKPAGADKNVWFKFVGNQVTLKVDGPETECMFRVDAGRTPKHLDFIPTEKTRGLVERKLLPAVYELNGDELRIAIPHSDDRPTELKRQAGRTLITLRKNRP